MFFNKASKFRKSETLKTAFRQYQVQNVSQFLLEANLYPRFPDPITETAAARLIFLCCVGHSTDFRKVLEQDVKSGECVERIAELLTDTKKINELKYLELYFDRENYHSAIVKIYEKDKEYSGSDPKALLSKNYLCCHKLTKDFLFRIYGEMHAEFYEGDEKNLLINAILNNS